MNPIKIVWELIKLPFQFIVWFIKDTIDDVGFVKKFMSNDPEATSKVNRVLGVFANSSKEEYKEALIGAWPLVLMVILGLLVGVFIGGKYYQKECNEYIIENIVKKGLILQVSPPGINSSFFSYNGTPPENVLDQRVK